MKKLFIISGSFFVFSLVLFLSYNFAFKKSGEDAQKKSIEFEKNNREESVNTKIRPITSIKASEFFLYKEKETIRFYSKETGKIYESDFYGQGGKMISNNFWPGASDIKWNPQGDGFIISFDKESGQKEFIFFDEVSKKETVLGKGIDAISWGGSGKSIFYKYFDSNTSKSNLSSANPNGSDWKYLTDINFRYLAIAPIPQTQLVSFWNDGHSKEETSLSVVKNSGGEVNEIFSGKFGADYLWSADGKKAFVSFLGENNSLNSGIISREGAFVDLKIPTIVSKVTWSSDGKVLYFAIPGAFSKSMAWPEDYKTEKFSTTDTLWKVDIETGKQERILEIDSYAAEYDVYSPKLSMNENALFFLNRKDGLVYRLEL